MCSCRRPRQGPQAGVSAGIRRLRNNHPHPQEGHWPGRGAQSRPESEEAGDADRPGSCSPALGPHTFAALTLPYSYPHVQLRRPRHRGAKKLAQGHLANTLTEPGFDPRPQSQCFKVPQAIGSHRRLLRERGTWSLCMELAEDEAGGEVWPQSRPCL